MKNKKVLIIVISAIVLFVVLFVSLFVYITNSSDKYVCTSDQGSITIYYKKGKIVGYSASRYSYDLEEQQAYAEKIGIELYFEEFNTWFVEHSTNGKCEKK